ncbi:MAG TPA: hypothetical protein VGF81_14760, partial [Solirubrobacteraceae bacterium]
APAPQSVSNTLPPTNQHDGGNFHGDSGERAQGQDHASGHDASRRMDSGGGDRGGNGGGDGGGGHSHSDG